MLKGLKSVDLKIIQNVSLPAKMEKIYSMRKLVGLQLFWSGTPTFSSGTPTFCQMGVLNSCFQNPSESSAIAPCPKDKQSIEVIIVPQTGKSCEFKIVPAPSLL